MKSKFHTTNSEYNPKWLTTDIQDIKTAKIPSFKQIDQNLKKYKQETTKIKSELKDVRTAFQMISEPYYNNTFDDKDRRLLNLTDFNEQKFPMDVDKYKEPDRLLNHGNELFYTSNMMYGALKPSKNDINENWYPKNTKFTALHNGKQLKTEGLNTNMTNNRVNDMIDYI